MILVAPGASVFDCYVQRVLIQMGLLKSIKYLMFEGAALNGIVDELNGSMNISGIDFMSFTDVVFGQAWDDRLLRE